MTLQELELSLERARRDLRAHESQEHPAGACLHGWLDGLARLTDAVRDAERALFAARGEAHAVTWDAVPFLRFERLPRVFLRDPGRVTVLAAVKDVPPDWKGKRVGEEMSYSDDRPVARIEFRDAEARWSTPGAGDVERHPLFGRGLDPTRPLRVGHSTWAGRGQHHLLLFQPASLEIRGTADPVEVWAMTLDEAARSCGGRALEAPAV